MPISAQQHSGQHSGQHFGTLSPSRRRRWNLLLCQGYLFSFGVGGLLTQAMGFLSDYNDQQYAYGLSLLYWIILGLYPCFSGYLAGSIWRSDENICRDFCKKHLIYAFLLSIPLLLCEFLQSVSHKQGKTTSEDVLIFFLTHSVLRTSFVLFGIWAGLKEQRGSNP
jgi:MFS family permease